MTTETGVPVKQDEEHSHVEQTHHRHNALMPLFTRPVQRQRWGDTQIQPVVNWGDLFFDLFYVAAAYNLSTIIRESPTKEGLLYFCGLFFCVLWMWLDKMYYDSRFYTRDDVWHRVFEMAVLVVLATAVLHIRPVAFMENPQKYVDMFAFSLACVLGNVLTIVRYIEIHFWVDGEEAARKSARRDAFAKMLPTGFYVAAMVVSAVEYYGKKDYGEDSHRDLANETAADSYATSASSYSTTDVPIWLLLGATFASTVWQWTMIVFCFPGEGRHKEITVPMNIDFCIHRYGEWTMLMLGESILSLLIVEVTGGVDYYATFYTGILSVILLQYLHFRSQPHHPDDHAMRRKKEAGLGFSYLMQIYSAALILLGTCYKMFLYEYVYEDYENSHRMLLWEIPRLLAGGDSGALQYDAEDRQQRIANFFCVSLAIVWICQDLMMLMHKGLKDNMGRCRCKHTHKTKFVGIALIMARVGLIVFIVTLRGYVTDPLLLAVIGLCGIIAQVILRVISSIVFPDDGFHTEGVDEHGNPIIVEDAEDENKWPNTTQAQALPGKARDDPEATTRTNSASDEQGASTEEQGASSEEQGGSSG